MKEKINITIHKSKVCSYHKNIESASKYWLFESYNNIDFYYQNKLITVQKYER